jgi:hypothetical protein
MHKVCKFLCIFNLALAVGVLLPIMFTSYPNSFKELSGVTFSDAFAPGKLGFILIQLVLIAISAIGSFCLLNGWGGKLAELFVIVLVILALVASVFNPYSLGYLTVFQNILFLYLEWGKFLENKKE